MFLYAKAWTTPDEKGLQRISSICFAELIKYSKDNKQ